MVELQVLRDYLDALHPGVPLDNMESEPHIRFMVFVKKIFLTLGMLERIHEYMIGEAEKDGLNGAE